MVSLFVARQDFFLQNLSPLIPLGCLKIRRHYFSLAQDLKAANKLGTVTHCTTLLQNASTLPPRKIPKPDREMEKAENLHFWTHLSPNINVCGLHLPFPKPRCLLWESTGSLTWTKKWASWFLFLSRSQANWATLLPEVSVGVRQAKLDGEGCNQEQSLTKTLWLLAPPPGVQPLSIVLLAQFSAWANQPRWRRTPDGTKPRFPTAKGSEVLHLCTITWFLVKSQLPLSRAGHVSRSMFQHSLCWRREEGKVCASEQTWRVAALTATLHSKEL